MKKIDGSKTSKESAMLNMIRAKKAHRPDCRYAVGDDWKWPDTKGFTSYEAVSVYLRDKNESEPGVYVEPCDHCLPAPAVVR